MKRKNIVLALLAMGMVLTAGLGQTWAYFTTYVEVEGGYPVQLGGRSETHSEEDFSDWTKHVRITNGEGSAPVLVRARAFCGSLYTLNYSSPSGKWTYDSSDGFYYYSDIVNGGETTEELQIRIENVPEAETDPSAFNVIVVYESTPVRYDADGNPYGSWDEGKDSESSEGR